MSRLWNGLESWPLVAARGVLVVPVAHALVKAYTYDIHVTNSENPIKLTNINIEQAFHIFTLNW